MGEILYFCFGKHGEKKAEKSRKIAQSLPGDDSTDTSAADVIAYLTCVKSGENLIYEYMTAKAT